MAREQKSIITRTKACPQCGGKISPAAKFCTNCGHKLSVKPIELLKIKESPEDQQQKALVFDRLREFLDFTHNPDRQYVQGTFELIDRYFVANEELPDILVLLLEHPYSLVREKAAFYLAQSEQGVQKMLEILNGGNTWLRKTAIRILGRVRAKEAVPALVHMYERAADLWLKQDILYAFGEIGDRQPFNTVMRALDSAEAEIICAAATALKAMADPAAIQYLIPKLAWGDTKVENTVQESIKSFGSKAVGILVKTLLDQRTPEKNKEKILEVLKDIPDPMAVPLLINLVQQEQALVLPIIKIMAVWKYKEFIPVLEKITEDPARGRRIEAQFALKQIKESS